MAPNCKDPRFFHCKDDEGLNFQQPRNISDYLQVILIKVAAILFFINILGGKMGLTNKKEEQLRKMPLIQNVIRRSKDGRYLIHKIVITTIRPMAYYKAIMDNSVVVEEEDASTLTDYFNTASNLEVKKGSEI